MQAGGTDGRGFVVTFDYPRQCISYECVLHSQPGDVQLKNYAKSIYGTLVVPVVFTYQNHSITARACIDTGAGASILAPRLTKALVPSKDPVRRKQTSARFGDGDISVFEITERIQMSIGPVTVTADSALMLSDSSEVPSAMTGHDALIGTSFLKDLVLIIDYQESPISVYIRP